jgi:hypothetical protein
LKPGAFEYEYGFNCIQLYSPTVVPCGATNVAALPSATHPAAKAMRLGSVQGTNADESSDDAARQTPPLPRAAALRRQTPTPRVGTPMVLTPFFKDDDVTGERTSRRDEEEEEDGAVNAAAVGAVIITVNILVVVVAVLRAVLCVGGRGRRGRRGETRH